MLKIGIPRALLYYQYYPLWSTFFEEMGMEVVTSDPTSKAIMAGGSARMVAETCLPVKVYCGHVLDLIGKCDYLFVPAIRSIQKNVYNCSKFLGLPDLIKAVVPQCPPIIDVDIDASKGKVGLHPGTYDIGRWIRPRPSRAKVAAKLAWQAHLAYMQELTARAITPVEYLNGQEAAASSNAKAHLTIALIGHPYNIYDEFITHRIQHRLASLGARVVTPEMAGQAALAAGVEKVVGQPYWTYEDEIVGAGGYYLEAGVDGVVAVVSFGCGPDSTMIDVVQRFARRPGARPLLTLTIDEHTGEAGLVTRIEAFLDMVARKARRPS
ncbi:MAG TPA: acyl-CoA dehydratase activase-related protein [Dehalococcoidia bacterium]|nr:acyl-CoA dehydratase activase-related protein [Dehalococcoidia bacterium]